ncbi:MAG: aspartate--tRNA ligase [Microgenomates group bacterium]
MNRTLAKDTVKKVGEKVELAGWVNSIRDHGKVTFIDIRDRSGIVQLVGEKLPKVSPESVVEVVGKVAKRPEKLINPNLETGKVEIRIEKLKVISTAKEIPIPLDTEGYEIEEGTRLKYRYLDLRRERLTKNFRLRHKLIQGVRDGFTKHEFVEIETPHLSKATPEGARDFLVPSRLQPGKFYALPQSPQQYKQLLMVAGFERYFQIARCYRDEDLRADRQFEFTQLDMEMSFPTQEEILRISEEILIDVTEKIAGKKIAQKPFPRFTYEEVIKKFGKDKFDLRKKKDDQILSFAWITDFPLFEKSEDRDISPSHHPFTAPKEDDIPLLDKKPMEVRSWQHDLICNGHEVAGGSIRITDPEVQKKIFSILGHKDKEIEEKFGHLLQSFEYGVPPHGGIAWGLDRLIALWCGEKAIREVISFPLTSSGQTAVMDAPSEADTEQLADLGIKIVKSRKNKE